MSEKTVVIEEVPEELKARRTKLIEEPDDAETRRMIQRMIKNIQYEQTSKSLMDTLIMSDFEVTEFFNILRSSWASGGDRMLTLLGTEVGLGCPGRESWRLERAGFVGIDNKLWCRGCGGVVTDMPEFCTLTLIHTWMNPTCPALLGIRDTQRCVRGVEIAEEPKVDDPIPKDNLKELMESDFPIYERRMITPVARAASWGTYPNGDPVGRQNRMVMAGWYAQDHSTGKKARCFCCGVEKATWRADDCPYLAHLKESPGCPYLHAIMSEETIIGLLAGHREEIKRHPWKMTVGYDYFKKMVFPPQVVTHERLGWNQRSTPLQRKSDAVKEKLIADWIIDQRIHESPPSENRAKRSKRALNRAEIVDNNQWHTRRTDINTRVQGLGMRGQEPFYYTPNWKREEWFTKGWGVLFNYNRSITLQNEHLILE